LLGDLKFGKNRAKVDLSELGKKYGIDLGEEVYKDKYLSPGLGAEYTTDEGTKFNLMVNPEDKGGSVSVSRSFATGGRVGYMGGGSTGLDYLTGMDRNNYQYGGDVYEKYLSYLNDLESRGAPTSSNILYSQPSYTYQQSDGGDTEAAPTTTGVPSTFQPTPMDIAQFALNPLMGLANLASRRSTGLSLVQRGMDAMGIGRGPGGRTEGYGVDSVAGMASGPTHGVDDVNSQSVGADASAGGDAGAAAASAAGSNDGPGGGTFAQGGRVGFNEGTLDPAKEKQIKQMLKMGADVDTISTITGATPEQIQQIQQTPRIKNADGGLNYLLGF